jgi:HAD superfamily hydrolase (TIGR01509 family)
MAELAALLFDIDGTLAETEDIHCEAFNEAFANADLDWHWSRALYGELLAVTGGRERIRYYLENWGIEIPKIADLDAYIAELHADKTRIYTEKVRTGQVPLRPGVRRLINEARAAGMRLAIATTTTADNVSALLQASLDPGAESWFEIIAAGGVVPAKKPAPDIYKYTLERMGLEGRQCLALEDSHNGLVSALAASVPTLIITSRYTVEQDFTGASLVVDQLGEPDAPSRVLAGYMNGAAYVNLDVLRRVHAASQH